MDLTQSKDGAPTNRYRSNDGQNGFAQESFEDDSTSQGLLPVSADEHFSSEDAPGKARRDTKGGKERASEDAQPAKSNGCSNDVPEVYSMKDALLKHGSTILTPFTDQTGSAEHVVRGLCVLISFGTVLGIIMPNDPHLPTPWYRLLSSILGYTYFISWSVSFYPQAVLNYRRGSTEGVSSDFCAINVLGYACYTGYTAGFYWSPGIKKLYAERNGEGSESTVQSNDVAFALHALVLSLVWLGQLFYYGGFHDRPPSGGVIIALCLTWTACLASAGFITAGHSGEYTWLDYLYLLSFVKVAVTVTKYIPQAWYNCKRRSTKGWNIWTILTDFTGGMLSLLQLVLDSTDIRDWSGITGNSAKLGLSLISIGFDIVFLLQHYVLYPNHSPTLETECSGELLIEMKNKANDAPGDVQLV